MKRINKRRIDRAKFQKDVYTTVYGERDKLISGYRSIINHRKLYETSIPIASETHKQSNAELIFGISVWVTAVVVGLMFFCKGL